MLFFNYKFLSPELFINFVRFTVVGIFNTVINYSVYYYLFGILNFNFIVAGSIGFGAGAIAGYICNRYWTFQSTIPFLKGGLKYLLIQCLCLCVYLLAITFVVNILGISKFFSPYFGMFVTIFLNFFLSKKLMYAK